MYFRSFFLVLGRVYCQNQVWIPSCLVARYSPFMVYSDIKCRKWFLWWEHTSPSLWEQTKTPISFATNLKVLLHSFVYCILFTELVLQLVYFIVYSLVSLSLFVGPFRDVRPSVQCIALAILRLISPPFSYKRCQHVDLWALLVVVCIDNTNFDLSFLSLVWLTFNKNAII